MQGNLQYLEHTLEHGSSAQKELAKQRRRMLKDVLKATTQPSTSIEERLKCLQSKFVQLIQEQNKQDKDMLVVQAQLDAAEQQVATGAQFSLREHSMVAQSSIVKQQFQDPFWLQRVDCRMFSAPNRWLRYSLITPITPLLHPAHLIAAGRADLQRANQKVDRLQQLARTLQKENKLTADEVQMRKEQLDNFRAATQVRQPEAVRQALV